MHCGNNLPTSAVTINDLLVTCIASESNTQGINNCNDCIIICRRICNYWPTVVVIVLSSFVYLWLQVRAPDLFVVQTGDFLGITNEQDFCGVPRIFINGYPCYISSVTRPDVGSTVTFDSLPYGAQFSIAVEIDPSETPKRLRQS